MTRKDYIDAIRHSTSKAEIDSLKARYGKDRDLDPIDKFIVDKAVSSRLQTPVDQLFAETFA